MDPSPASSTVFESPSVGLAVWDVETGETLATNERYRELLGRSGREDASLEEATASIQGYGPEYTRERLRAATAEGVRTFDCPCEGSDGEMRWVEVTASTAGVSGGRLHLCLVDVTDRKEAEHERDRYETILESLDDAVYAIDTEGTVVYINGSYASMKGVPREELLGSDIYRWATDDAAEAVREARRAMIAGDRTAGSVEVEFSTIDGGSIPVEMRFSSVPRPGDGIERAGVLRDVTERKARERALRRKNRRLDEFTSVVSHDLRNPLNVAEGYLEMVRARYDDDELTQVAKAHERMATLIDDLLALAREGASVGDLKTVELAAAVERCWRGVDTADASLVVETDRVVAADGSRLQQLLENLVRNAVEHGGREVTVTVGDLDGGFFLEDDGPGVPSEERGRVFDTGYSTNGGSGFGLGIAERIAEAHGWGIRAVEGASGGARFEITVDGTNA